MNLTQNGQEFSELDRHFARFIAKISGDGRKEIWLAAALLSRSTTEGNICLDIKAFAGLPVTGDTEAYPSSTAWMKILGENSAVGKPGDYRPIILDDKGRLYLYRYWDYEKKLIDFICEKAHNPWKNAWLENNVHLIRDTLTLLFPRGPEGEADWQKLAAATSLLKRFTVISGSPGTGKTTTITKIMALLLASAADKKMSIALTAPTGKAAVRLQEAVKKSKALLSCSDAVRGAIPETATTVHRLLGSIPHSPYFRHHRENPLSFDAVIVDEASMVDLPLMAKLVEALPAAVRLILLGDKDQLTSVEAGAVLGDLCGSASLDIFPLPFIEKLDFATGDAWEGILHPGGSELHESLVELKKNYRFSGTSGIGRLSAAVNNGDGVAAISLLESTVFADVRWLSPYHGDLLPYLKSRVVEGYRTYLQALANGNPAEIFDLFEDFRILCALRQGPYGVEAINDLAERLLAAEGLITPGQIWYSGRPIMITRNDYQQRLFNGDVGIVMADPEEMHALRAFFRDASGVMRKFLPLRLPAHETVYAMTVHKSQGSEFNRILFILPEKDVPLLTRELIYTGLTRARNLVEIWCREDILRDAVSRRTTRVSGLRDALWGSD